MRSRIDPPKKIVRSLREHLELILNCFRPKKMIPSGTVGGLNNKAEVPMRESYGSRTFRFSNWPFITHLASSLSRSQPTISSDESEKRGQTQFPRAAAAEIASAPFFSCNLPG
jgi:hypothetical protein